MRMKMYAQVFSGKLSNASISNVFTFFVEYHGSLELGLHIVHTTSSSNFMFYQNANQTVIQMIIIIYEKEDNW